MIKPLFILINTVSVFIFSFFFGDSPVSVTGNIPKSAKPGTEFVAELKISKGAVGGFAKLQFEVPAGFTVKELESKGGNFSFANNIGKIIWTSTPSDPEFTVKLAVSTDVSVSGSKTLTSKFSYVNNNLKEVVEMIPAEIMIGDETSASSVVTSATETVTQTTQPLTAVETNTVTPVSSSTENTAVQNTTEPNSNVMCVRAISKGAADNEFNVQVKIKKPGIKGFAKYQEILPAGYTAKGVATSGSSFSVSDGKAKFVWVSLPADDEMIITYVLEKSASAATDATIAGEFSYLENDLTKKVKVPAELISVSGNVVASNVTTNNTPTTTAVTDNTTKTDVVATNTTQTTVISDNTTQTDNTSKIANTAKTDNTTTNNTVVAKKEGNVAYHVQIGAFANAIASDVLAKKFNINDKIKSEMAEGFSKFMIGNFGEYKEARTNRETMKEKGCRSAFVVAYNGAKRITVQEALMITNQKWFK
jgi:cell division septation protein DedD